MKRILTVILSILMLGVVSFGLVACSKTDITQENYSKYIVVAGEYEGEDFYITISPANENYEYKNVKIKIDVLLLLTSGSNMARGSKSLTIKLDENGYGKAKISVADGVFAMLQDYNIVGNSGSIVIPE